MTQLEWHGYGAWQIENEHVRMVVVPPLGAKIASLVDKATGDEWLSSPIRPIHPRRYGDSFLDHDMSGWDEMFPTINACPDPLVPGRRWPDHGEVWALPWDTTEQAADAITVQVTGNHALAYRLRRRASLRQEGGLRLDYELENLSGLPLPFLWAAHPLFNSGPDCAVILPVEVSQVINVGDHQRLGAPDTSLAWPVARLHDGHDQALNEVGAAALKDFRKVYVPPDQRINSAALRRVKRRLEMSWQSDVAPYLGIWVDEGLYTDPSTVALEPASGYYDALDKAYRNGRVALAPVGAPVRWWVDLRFEDAR